MIQYQLKRLPALFSRSIHTFCKQQTEAMNVLIYNGNGTSPNSVKQAYCTLKAVLGHAYDVMKVDATTLKTEPWEETCSLLVLPGGRDQPYCNDLNGTGNKKIADYVREGGNYLGFCAGAYYASKEIEFEKGQPEMEVIGSRELAFFPGLSRGTMFSGFVYNSEKGARSVSIVLKDGTKINTYYNGGGYFVKAKEAKNVKVICTFDESGLCGDREEDPAAGIQCQVGKGSAVLFGVHPEYDVSLVDLDGNDNKETIIRELTASLPACRELLCDTLAGIGLKVAQQESDVPSLTPLYLSAVNNRTLDAIKTKLLEQVDEHSILKDSNDSFYISEIGQQVNLPDMLKKLSIQGGESGQSPILEILYPRPSDEDNLSAVPEASLTPLFDLRSFYSALLLRRQSEWGGGSWYRFGNAMLYADVITSTQTVLDK